MTDRYIVIWVSCNMEFTFSSDRIDIAECRFEEMKLRGLPVVFMYIGSDGPRIIDSAGVKADTTGRSQTPKG